MKKTLKIVGFVLGGILVLFIVILLAISSGRFNHLIADKVSQTANQELNGELKIANIEGNLLSHFTINNLSLHQNEKELLGLDKLEIKYNLWAVMGKEIHADLIHIKGLSINLKQGSDSLWNLQKLVPLEDTSKKDTLPSSFSWIIDFEKVQLSDFVATIESIDSSRLIPHSLKLNTSLAFEMTPNRMKFNLDQFELVAQEPSLEVNHLKFQANLVDSVFSWKSFDLQMKNTNIHSTGSIPLNQLGNSQLTLKALPLDFDELNNWFPMLHGKPEIELQVSNKAKSSNISFKLTQNKQRITIFGQLANLNSRPTYEFIMEVDSLNGAYWTHNPELKSNIKGRIDLKGEGIDLKSSLLDVHAQFSDLKYANYEMDNFLLDFEKEKETLAGTVKAQTIFGKLDSRFHIEKILTTPEYKALLELKHFNLAKLTGNKKLQSNINLNLQTYGQGVEPGEMQANVILKSEKSVLFDQPLSNLNAKIEINKDKYKIEDFHIEAPYLSAKLNGEGMFSGNNQLSFNIQSKNIEKTVDALGLSPIHFEGETKGEISGPFNQLVFKSNTNIVDFKTVSSGLRNALVTIDSRFSVNTNFTENDSLQQTATTLPIGLKDLSFNTNMKIGFANWGDYYLENLEAEIEKSGESFHGELMTNSIMGNLKTKINVEKIFTKPNYSVSGTLNNINLARLIRNDNLSSDINLTIRAKGTAIDLKSLTADIELQSDSSTIFGMPLDDFSSKLSLNKGDYLLTGFNIKTPFVLVQGEGQGNWIKSNKLDFSVTSKDIQKLSSVLNQKDLQFAGQLTTDITGSLDSLNFSSNLNIEKLKFDSIQVEQLKVNSNMLISNKGNSGWVDLQLNDSRYQKLNVKTIHFKSDLNKLKATNSFKFKGSDSLYGNILSEWHFGNTPSLYFPEINLNIFNNNWIGGSDNSFIQFGKDSIVINQLEMTSRESAMRANGIFAFRGNEDLQLELKNLKLIEIPGLSFLPYRFTGNINALLDITGTAEKPVLSGSLNIDKPGIDQLRYSRFQSTINYDDEYLKLVGSLNKNTSPLIFAELKVPVHFSFTDSISINKTSKLLQGNVNINQLELSQFTPFIPLKGIATKGLLSLKMDIANTLNNPKIDGKFKLSKGAVSYKKLGIDYNKIEIRSQLNNNHFYLDSLHLFSGKGNLKMNGYVEFDSLLKGDLTKIDLNLSGENFRAFNSDMLKAVVNANLSVKGYAEHPVLKGKLSILSSTLNTDVFLKEYKGISNDFDQPLLVKAQKDAEEFKLNHIIRKDSNVKNTPDIYKNLKGEFEIEIPRNSWIKGKNMNFELAGKVRAIKEGEQIDFFGDLNIKRGYYKIYGRRLEVEEGTISLTGGQKIDPVVDFKIAYKFRDSENLLRKLNLNVSGRVSQPKVEFYLDDTVIEEKDAISCLLFNKTSSQLDTQETASASSSNVDIAKDLAIGQISNVMKDVLQSSLGLDAIEITGNGSGSQSSVSIGKYITNNLYLNYERTFALDKKDKIVEPEKISMEYQFYRSLFLQATNQSTNSGFDFIIKWTWR
ncbi:translocation/assembly module TamB domain-containing protein [Ancylomarina sp. 16SWW S1-10-2]|uniref:translocation/assembly module TamB domain-containing protein n=1 Tax=Ancylomarina sp. 16SWW S1-10-2 TaxID=2499681 RepID=UPI0012ADE7E8|nr:translocation/assembly module TamB domain-containing protein [Ancylomarina sp. 16SWW S1-10-2]MRT93935.1 translocation/assembly module TamB [Ancylomarina sp. 16SWW S1-10-2]